MGWRPPEPGLDIRRPQPYEIVMCKSRILAVSLLAAVLPWSGAGAENPPPEFLSRPVPNARFIPAELGAKIAVDRTYTILLLPEAMRGTWLLQGPVLQALQPLPAEAEIPRPCRVHVAIQYKHMAITAYTDRHFDECVANGWELLEDEFKTTTFQSEPWGWQVVWKDVGPGPLPFKNHGALCLYFAAPIPNEGKPAP